MGANGQEKNLASPREILALIEGVRVIRSNGQRQDLLKSLETVDQPTVLSFVNAHAVNLCSRDGAVLRAFRASDLLLRDGVGLSAGMRVLGLDPGLNMNGTDFIPLLLWTLPRRRLAIYGTGAPWLERARARLEQTTPHQVVDVLNGFHPTGRYVESACRHRPDVIVLAMGMPRQEEVAAELKRTLAHPVLIVNGGGVIDFMARRFRRAPVLIRRIGLEWAFRMAQEPRRLHRRYLHGCLLFARNVMLLRRLVHPRPAGAQAQGA